MACCKDFENAKKQLMDVIAVPDVKKLLNMETKTLLAEAGSERALKELVTSSAKMMEESLERVDAVCQSLQRIQEAQVMLA